MSALRDWARLDARWYADPLVRAAAASASEVMVLWPVLVGMAKHESHADDNPHGVILIHLDDLAHACRRSAECTHAALNALDESGLIWYTTEAANTLRISLSGFAKWQTARKSDAERKANKRWRDEAASRENVSLRHGDGTDASRSRHAEGMPDVDIDVDIDKEHTSTKAAPSLDIPRMLFDHWLTATNRNPNQNRLTAGRRAHVNGRLRDGYTVEQLQQAIDGIAGSAWHKGANPNGKRYDTFDFIMRSGENVEKGMEAATPAPAAAGDDRSAALLAYYQNGGAA